MNKKPVILRSVFALLVLGVFIFSMYPLQERDSIDTWQHYVQDHKLRPLRLQGVPEGGTVCKAAGLETGGTQRVFLNVADAVLVFYAIDHVVSSLWLPVTEKITHSAMLTA